MKKLVLVLGLLCSITIVVKAQSYSGGAGTKADPYQISTKADLKYLSENVGETKKHFLQTADIFFNSSDFAMGGDFYNNGEGFIPLATGTFGFEGSYNGGGHIIDSLYINKTNGPAAFINRTYSSDTFGFLALTNVNITGNIFTGAFAGQVYWGTVMDCYSTGTIKGNDRAGGITGSNVSRIIRCYSTASVTGAKNLGGLAGQNESSLINCYATGNVSGTDRVGGLTGELMFLGEIENCYAAGLVTGSTNSGGLVGERSGGTIKSSYWDSQTSGWITGNLGTPKNTVQLQSQATFTGWDFANHWKMGNCITNNGYPILTYQTLNVPNATVNFSLGATIQNEFCSGGAKGEIKLDVTGSSKYTFAWSNGSYTSSASGLAVGTYNVVVTDTANCGTIDTSFDIKAEPFFDSQAQASASSVCVSGSSTITLSKSAYGAKYYLRNDANDSIIDGPVIGTGGNISFTSNVITSATNYNILGASLNSGNSLDTVFFNAIEFTGDNDLKQVSLGDSLWIDHFQGKTAFTVEAWVNRSSTGNLHTILSNYTGSYPLLFRIDNDKISLYANSSASVTSSSTIPVGVWTHLAGTYDGSNLRVYINGEFEGVTAHSTPLQAANGGLRIGGGIANNTEYFLGSIADVRLWDKAKTAAEIKAQMQDRLSGTEPSLVANYQFNEGSGTTTANVVQANAKHTGNLVNSPAWVAGPEITQVLCLDEFATLVTANIGTYPDSTTSLNKVTITANEASATYQWIDCDNANAPINGETNQSFTATKNGNYAVIINNGTCQSTSECVNINSVGIEEFNKTLVQFYPNPSNGNVQIKLLNANQTIGSVNVINLLGKEVYRTTAYQNQVDLNLSNLPIGIYFVQMQIDGQNIIERIILE